MLHMHCTEHSRYFNARTMPTIVSTLACIASLCSYDTFFDLSILLHVTTVHSPEQSNVSGYGNIECNGNETKLEECTVRKDVQLQTCKVADMGLCYNSKIRLLHSVNVNVYISYCKHVIVKTPNQSAIEYLQSWDFYVNWTSVNLNM